MKQTTITLSGGPKYVIGWPDVLQHLYSHRFCLIFVAFHGIFFPSEFAFYGLVRYGLFSGLILRSSDPFLGLVEHAMVLIHYCILSCRTKLFCRTRSVCICEFMFRT